MNTYTDDRPEAGPTSVREFTGAQAPDAVRAIYDLQARRQDKSQSPAAQFRVRNMTPAQLRITALMRADRQAQREQIKAERRAKSSYLHRSIDAAKLIDRESTPLRRAASPVVHSARAIAHNALDTFKSARRYERDHLNTRPSPMQAANGYVCRFTPWESPIATGPMGALSNGLKPWTRDVQMLIDGGKQQAVRRTAVLLTRIQGRTHVLIKPAAKTAEPPKLHDLIADRAFKEKRREKSQQERVHHA